MSFLSNLFGGNSAPQIQYTPSGFTNPSGFSVSGSGGVTESPTLFSNIAGIQTASGNAATAFGNLAQTVQPGFSAFRRAGLRQISNTFNANKSNLQDTLAQRRILGSSFANSQFSENAANEAEAKANFEASSYLQELQSQYNLIQAQYTATTQGYTAAINQSNIEASTAAQLTASNNSTAAQIATANAELRAQSQAGAGSFLGTLLGVGTNALGGRGLFSSGGIFGGSSTGGSIGTDATIFNDSTSSFLGDVGSYLGDAALVA